MNRNKLCAAGGREELCSGLFGKRECLQFFSMICNFQRF